jgi:5-methylcytosine-specific restriction endonuclease McrA
MKQTPLKRKTAIRSKPKKHSRSFYSKRLDDLAKRFAKERDGYICQHTGQQVEGSNAHGSHVVPVSAGNALRWDLENIKCLSYHSHLNWWHKNPLEAAEWFKTTFPGRWDYLQNRRGIEFKRTTAELTELYRAALKCAGWVEYQDIYNSWIEFK